MDESLVTPPHAKLNYSCLAFCPNPHLFPIIREIASDYEIEVIGPALGAPAAALLLEPYLVEKPENLILLGTCGGLQEADLKLFDVVEPTAAISEVGVTKLYDASEEIGFVPSKIHKSIGAALDLRLKSGKIWSTDAPYRETKEKVDHYLNVGAVAVDMELAIVLHLANIYQVDLASYFIVSDLLGESWTKGFGNQKLIENFNTLCKTAFETVL